MFCLRVGDVKNIIALDVGTSSIRAILYREDGFIMYKSQVEYHSDYYDGGLVEQDPATWLEGSIRVLRDIGNFMNENEYQAEAISVTSQRSSLIPVDKNGTPLRSAIMWQDKRTLPQCDYLEKAFGLKYLYQKTGLRVNPYFVLPKIIWLKENQRDIYNKAYKFLGVQELIIYQLCGKFVTDYTQGGRTLFMDINSFTWDPDLLEIAGINESDLPELLPPGSIVGGLRKEIAEKTGLPEGLQIIIAGGDQQCAAVALGVTKPGTAEANTGTGSFVLAAVDKAVFDEECRVLVQASAIPGKWIMEAGIFNTGATYRWFKEQFYKDIPDGQNTYEIMNKEAAASGVGANGIVMIPHFQGSAAPFWNPYAKGLFFNLSLDHTRGDFVRSIMEGIAIELGHNIRLIQKLTGKINVVSVAGGMTKSDLFCEIQANVFNCKVARYKNTEASSLGAAISAFVALGIFDSEETAQTNMVGKDIQIFEPTKELVDEYHKITLRKMALYDSINVGDVYKGFMGEDENLLESLK